VPAPPAAAETLADTVTKKAALQQSRLLGRTATQESTGSACRHCPPVRQDCLLPAVTKAPGATSAITSPSSCCCWCCAAGCCRGSGCGC
jgi:hypothetical protein